MVTIGEVARYAGVSVATVSRVLNNSESVKPATAQRVLAAIRELDYIPNQSARNLRRSESRVILTLAPNFSNPYYSSILTGIGDLAHDCEYSVLICNTAGEAENEKRFLKMLEQHRADGAIFLGCHGNHGWLRNYAAEYPLVQCCEYVPALDSPSVSIDNYSAALETVNYLISLGHERIAMMSAANDFISTRQRVQGYRDALAGAGLKAGEKMLVMASADYSYASGLAAAEKLLALCGCGDEDVRRGAVDGLMRKVQAMGEAQVAEKLSVGVPTLRDVVKELVKPGRDLRDDLPAPILRTDVLDMKDLKPGMTLTGTVRNVIDFGVFVDIGVHQDGLVHISQVCNRFIKHPSEVVSVGDIVKVVVLDVDEKKKRISLSMKQVKE